MWPPGVPWGTNGPLEAGAEWLARGPHRPAALRSRRCPGCSPPLSPRPGRPPPCVCSGGPPRGRPCRSSCPRTARSSARCDRGRRPARHGPAAAETGHLKCLLRLLRHHRHRRRLMAWSRDFFFFTSVCSAVLVRGFVFVNSLRDPCNTIMLRPRRLARGSRGLAELTGGVCPFAPGLWQGTHEAGGPRRALTCSAPGPGTCLENSPASRPTAAGGWPRLTGAPRSPAPWVLQGCPGWGASPLRMCSVMHTAPAGRRSACPAGGSTSRPRYFADPVNPVGGPSCSAL